MARLVGFLTVPWSGFVAGFLYYVVLTLIAIGGVRLSDSFVAVAYGIPVLAYVSFVLTRGTFGDGAAAR